MPVATNQQVQNYADQRIRPRAEQFRALVAACADDKRAIDDPYAHCVQQSPTWTDSRGDAPPHLLAPSDVLVYNAIITLFAKLIAGTLTLQDVADFSANWSVFQAACVRPLPNSVPQS